MLIWLFSLLDIRFPHFTGDDVLQPFVSTVKKGKASAEFMALIERALQAEVAEEDNGISERQFIQLNKRRY